MSEVKAWSLSGHAHSSCATKAPVVQWVPNRYSTLQEQTRINEQIRAEMLRVIGRDGENLGILTREDALKQARADELDLIEISSRVDPPIAKIADYGKFLYEQKKKVRASKLRTQITETKTVQVKVGTGEHDLDLKAGRVGAWLSEGHRVRVDLFLWGRYKYMEEGFLKERMERFLKRIPHAYKIAEEIKRSPKGMTATIEPDKVSQRQKEKPPTTIETHHENQ